MTFDTFSFHFEHIVADVYISEEIVNEIFKLCPKHKISILFESLVYSCKVVIEPNLSDIRLFLSVEEENPEIQSEYEAELSDEIKNKLINDFKTQFLSFMDKAA